jgi:F0F1-type ATP synthase assembly protein I
VQDSSRPGGNPSGKPNLWRFAAIGVELFSPIIGGSIAGYYLDSYLHTGSVWTIIGLIGGTFLGFYRLIAEARQFQKNS